EVQMLDQRAYRCLRALQEIDVAAPWLEIRRQLELVRLVVDDLPDGGEGLQRLAVRIDGLRRIEDDPVTPGHLLQHVRLAVVGLCEAAPHATPDGVTTAGI